MGKSNSAIRSNIFSFIPRRSDCEKCGGCEVPNDDKGIPAFGFVAKVCRAGLRLPRPDKSGLAMT
jgi:hypothetical protein